MSYFYFYTELDETEIDVMFSPRNEGELKELTERLHSYIAKMRELRNGAPHLDSHNFFKVCLLGCIESYCHAQTLVVKKYKKATLFP